MVNDHIFEDDKEDEEELDEDEFEEVEAEAEIITIDPNVFKTSIDKKAKVEGIPEYDSSKFIYHPEDGMITPILDEHGCSYGYKWNEKMSRCIPVQD